MCRKKNVAMDFAKLHLNWLYCLEDLDSALVQQQTNKAKKKSPLSTFLSRKYFPGRRRAIPTGRILGAHVKFVFATSIQWLPLYRAGVLIISGQN